jgi:transmembrane sensor
MVASEEDALGDGARAEAAAWLARLRGTSTAEDHAAFEEWYDADPRHAAAYEAILESWETAGLARTTPIGIGRSGLAPAGARRWRYAMAAIAATIVIVVLAFGANGAGIIGPKTNRPIEFASGADEVRTVDLADGSRVTLGGNSLLRSAFVAGERRVWLSQGRARFAVAHDAARPFIVETPAGLIIAHGTVFDVTITGARVAVSLLQGSVEVRPAVSSSRAVPITPAMLSPGQRTVMVAGEPPSPPTSTKNSVAESQDGMLSFENAPLGDVVAAVNRKAARQIVLSDPALAELRFTGTFHAAATDELAAMLAAMFDLRLSHDRGVIILGPSRV